MRKIETLMNDAIKNGDDWSLDNTRVEHIGDAAYVYLHGNLISKVGDEFIELFDGGWQSNTTKSRLNAILSEYGMEGERVFQRNYQWFVNYNGSPIPFFSGMRMNWKSSALWSYSAVDCPIIVITTHSTMTRSTALGMLNVGNNGNEILAILDVIVADIESEQTINDIADMLFNMERTLKGYW